MISFNPFSILDNLTGFSDRKQREREEENAKRNYAMAKHFAQNSMQWKAEDLRKAGINPIYGIGSGGYSAPVSSGGSAPNLGTAGSISISPKIEKASANAIQAQANKTNAEAKATDTLSKKISEEPKTDYQLLTGVDGRTRLFQSQEASEALENDFLGRLGWHGRNMLPLVGAKYEERWNNVYNTLVASKRLNPLTQDLDMDMFGGYKVVPRKPLRRSEKFRAKMKPFSWH